MKTVFISGASSGFGANCALQLAKRGWRVYAGMRDAAKAAELLEAAELAGASGELRPVTLDVTSVQSVETAVTAALAECGGAIDVVLNNAGSTNIGFFEDVSDDEFRAVMETNFFGAVALTRAFVPSMRQACRGRIVVVTSNALNAPHPALTAYAASKWALEGWAEGLAMELAPFNVDVTVVQPGNHATPFGSHARPVRPQDGPYEPMWRACEPGLARLVAWARDPDKATGPLLDAITAQRPGFRRQIGFDAQLFALMKGVLPYSARVLALRRSIGFPGRGTQAR